MVDNDNNNAQTPTTCPRCRRSMETFPGTPVNFCSECGTPITPDPVRERIVDLMLNGIRDDMAKAVARLEQDEPERYGRLAAIIAGGSG